MLLYLILEFWELSAIALVEGIRGIVKGGEASVVYFVLEFGQLSLGLALLGRITVLGLSGRSRFVESVGKDGLFSLWSRRLVLIRRGAYLSTVSIFDLICHINPFRRGRVKVRFSKYTKGSSPYIKLFRTAPAVKPFCQGRST